MSQPSHCMTAETELAPCPRCGALGWVEPCSECCVCDDCGTAYGGPAYYTFDSDGCEWTVNGVFEPHECTENLCPGCAGPFLTPDDENDKRVPPIDFYDERLHGNMEVAHEAH